MSKAGLWMVTMAVVIGSCQAACVVARETRHETNAVELDKAESVRMRVEMGGGELHVKSGTAKLLDADFAFNVPEWRPVVDYRTTSSRGDLTISQPKSPSFSRGGVNRWTLNVNDGVPSDVTINMGAGEADLTLGRMNLRSVEVDMGAGEMKIDLRGEPKQGYAVQVHAGAGETTIQLPKDVGISATATGGIGEVTASGLEKRDGVWINPERVDAPVTVRVDVKGGVGAIHLVR